MKQDETYSKVKLKSEDIVRWEDVIDKKQISSGKYLVQMEVGRYHTHVLVWSECYMFEMVQKEPVASF